MEISDSAIEQARQRMRDRLDTTPHATTAHYDRRASRVVVGLSSERAGAGVSAASG